MSRKCSAKNRKGERCGAWALRRGTQCAIHSDPELAAKMGSRHGRKVTFSPAPNALDLPFRPLKSNGDMIEFLEETMNRIRQGPVDIRTANVIGRLAGILLKAIDQGTARTSAEENSSLKSQLYAKRLYLPDWRRETLKDYRKKNWKSRSAWGTEDQHPEKVLAR